MGCFYLSITKVVTLVRQYPPKPNVSLQQPHKYPSEAQHQHSLDWRWSGWFRLPTVLAGLEKTKCVVLVLAATRAVLISYRIAPAFPRSRVHQVWLSSYRSLIFPTNSMVPSWPENKGLINSRRWLGGPLNSPKFSPRPLWWPIVPCIGASIWWRPLSFRARSVGLLWWMWTPPRCRSRFDRHCSRRTWIDWHLWNFLRGHWWTSTIGLYLRTWLPVWWYSLARNWFQLALCARWTCGSINKWAVDGFDIENYLHERWADFRWWAFDWWRGHATVWIS